MSKKLQLIKMFSDGTDTWCCDNSHDDKFYTVRDGSIISKYFECVNGMVMYKKGNDLHYTELLPITKEISKEYNVSNKIQKWLRKAYKTSKSRIYIHGIEYRLLDNSNHMFGYMDDDEVVVKYYKTIDGVVRVPVEEFKSIPLEPVEELDNEPFNNYLVDDDILDELVNMIVTTKGNPNINALEDMIHNIKKHPLED